MKSISVIIVNYYSYKYLNRLLNEIYNKKGLEFLIINNGDVANFSRIKISFPDVIILENKNNLGFSKACNIGAKIAKGNILLFLNPDSLITYSDIIKMKNFLLNNRNIGVVGPKIYFPDGTLQESAFRFDNFLTVTFNITHIDKLFPVRVLHPKGIQPLYPHWITGACLMIKKDLFLKVGGFDEDYFMFSEDEDLCLKVKKAGYKVALIPDAKMIHYREKSRQNNLNKMELEFYKSMIIFFKKNKSRIEYLSVKTSYLLESIIKLPILLISNINGVRKYLKVNRYKELILSILRREL